VLRGVQPVTRTPNLPGERDTQPDRLAQQSAIEREHHRPARIDHRRAQQDGIHPADSLARDGMALDQRLDIGLWWALYAWEQAKPLYQQIALFATPKHDLAKHVRVDQCT
jgi:hypothetical protein